MLNLSSLEMKRKFMEKIFRRNMILIPLLCHDKNSGMKVLEGNCYDKLRQSSAIGLAPSGSGQNLVNRAQV